MPSTGLSNINSKTPRSFFFFCYLKIDATELRGTSIRKAYVFSQKIYIVYIARQLVVKCSLCGGKYFLSPCTVACRQNNTRLYDAIRDVIVYFLGTFKFVKEIDRRLTTFHIQKPPPKTDTPSITKFYVQKKCLHLIMKF